MMGLRILYFLGIIVILTFLNCGTSAISNIQSEEKAKVEYGMVAKLGPDSASISWKCSSRADAYLVSSMGVFPSLTPAKEHFFTLNGLSPQTDYETFVTCGAAETNSGMQLNFRTWVSNTPQKTQGIWILGGIGSDQNPVAQVDLYDSANNIWYPAVTSIPTPRAFASILSHKNKIYVIGGLEKSGSTYSTSLKVEAYDPYSDTWEVKTDLPIAVQGGVEASVGEEIYILSGSSSVNVTISPMLNTVLKFYPDLSTTGQWISYQSLSILFARADMAGCGLDGTIFYSGGRQNTVSSTGSPAIGTDGFSPLANSITSASEPSISQARFGAGVVCVNPEPKDLNPQDNQWFAIFGGSTTQDTNQPVVTISPSSNVDFYQPGSATFLAGTPSLPQALYYPAAQASYETRNIYVFGGANSLNTPIDTIYSINSATPASSSWSTLTTIMPRPRFGHKAIRLDR